MKGLTAQGNQFLWKVDTYIIFAGVLTKTFNYYYFKVIFIVWLFSIFIKCFFRRRLLLCNYYLDIIVTIFHPQVQPNMSQVFFFSYLHNSALSLFRNELIKCSSKMLKNLSYFCNSKLLFLFFISCCFISLPI